MNSTELEIQKRLYWRLGEKREYAMPNVYVFENESDFLTVTRAGYIDEYEVKISRSDFRADFKKRRHINYQTLTPWRWYTRGDVTWLYGRNVQYPNRFWYAVPEDLVTPDEVPEYAGLIYVTDKGMAVEAKKAPKLHGNKASDATMNKVLRAGYFRYIDGWRNRAA